MALVVKHALMLELGASVLVLIDIIMKMEPKILFAKIV